METLALTAFVNHQTADGSRQPAVPATRIVLPPALRRLPSLFITFAVEIEGDAPLYFVTEAIDD